MTAPDAGTPAPPSNPPAPLPPKKLDKEQTDKAVAMKEKALESLAGGLAQVKHIRAHLKDGISRSAEEVLEQHIKRIEDQIQELYEVNLTE